MKPSLLALLLTGCLLAAAVLLSFSGKENAVTEWPDYLGGPDRSHYSPLNEINTGNVGKLRVAWQFHTGDSGEVQCNPLITGGKLYALTARNRVICLDAATGRLLWAFADTARTTLSTGRGLALSLIHI